MISVLIPSRGRPDQLRESISSLRGQAADSSAIEICVIADHDDPDTRFEVLDLIRAMWVDQYLEVDRYGYANMHRYYNDLADVSIGNYLMLWNDDARMTTPCWDWQITDAFTNRPSLLVGDLQSNMSPEFVAFPVIPRALYDVLGHFSEATPHVDSYLQDIGRALGRVHPIDVMIQHDRPDLSGAQPDATFLEGRTGLNHQHYFSPEFQAVIAASIEKIRESGI